MWEKIKTLLFILLVVSTAALIPDDFSSTGHDPFAHLPHCVGVFGLILSYCFLRIDWHDNRKVDFSEFFMLCIGTIPLAVLIYWYPRFFFAFGALAILIAHRWKRKKEQSYSTDDKSNP
jgi:hypothetical protein